MLSDRAQVLFLLQKIKDFNIPNAPNQIKLNYSDKI